MFDLRGIIGTLSPGGRTFFLTGTCSSYLLTVNTVQLPSYPYGGTEQTGEGQTDSRRSWQQGGNRSKMASHEQLVSDSPCPRWTPDSVLDLRTRFKSVCVVFNVAHLISGLIYAQLFGPIWTQRRPSPHILCSFHPCFQTAVPLVTNTKQRTRKWQKVRVISSQMTNAILAESTVNAMQQYMVWKAQWLKLH